MIPSLFKYLGNGESYENYAVNSWFTLLMGISVNTDSQAAKFWIMYLNQYKNAFEHFFTDSTWPKNTIIT